MKRRWHPWNRWECVPAGLYETTATISPGEAVASYAVFLRDIPRFEKALRRVISEWPISCEHFLSNISMNRIAWLGQASMCIDNGTSCFFRGGFRLLSQPEQEAANAMADKYLKIWESNEAKN